MEGGLTKPRGYHVSKPCAFLIACLVLITVASALFAVYVLAPCPCETSSESDFYRRLSKRSDLYVRLPRSVRPDTYKLRLIPFLERGNFTFIGSVDILVNVTRVTSNITLHASDLKIKNTNLRRVIDNGVTDSVLNPHHVPISNTEYDVSRNFFIIRTSQTLTPGQYEVSMNFTGELNDALIGFYRSSYDVNNVTRWIATTQFQATDARRAFPCFDEPALKAKFSISIGRPSSMSSISNMPKIGFPESVAGIPNYEWDHYMESVPMSTYLVAFTVSDYEHLSDGKFSVWTRAQALNQAKYALKIGPEILRYFEEFFQVSFPLPKTDMIALPDFAAGAMENWGLITFRENAMLFQEGVSTNRHKERVGTVIAHELAHQWFGNLVTPSWWSDLWLNEGFATYTEKLGIDFVEPTWRTSDQFVVTELQYVLEQDAFKSSHPVSATVSHPDEIDELFDSISYGKGASIIRMMDHFLTTPVFKKGITNYLNSRKYQSATQDDLWQALTEQAHKDRALESDMTVKKIMDSWTLKTGFPVVTVTRNYEEGSAIISQKRFLYRGMNSESGSNWWVPLSYTSQSRLDSQSTRPSHWLKAEESLTVRSLKTPSHDWVLFNLNKTGYYRVNYDARNWELLLETLKDPEKFQQIRELNRAQLIDDSMHLARAGLLNYSVALDLTTYLSEEVAFIPWDAAFPTFDFIDVMLNKMPIYDKFKKYVLHLISKLYRDTGFVDNTNENQLKIYKRVEVLKLACSLGLEDCVRNAVLQFQNWRSTPQPDKNNPISPNLKLTVYCTAIRVGGQIEWEFAWERYLRANVGSEKSLLLNALGCTRETWILSRYLHWAVTEGSGIRKQDVSTVFNAVASNVIGQQLAFAFVRDNWKKIKDFLGLTSYPLTTIIKATTCDMNTEFDLKMVKEFAMAQGQKGLGSATKAVDQAIEVVEGNVHWMKNYYNQVEHWLEHVTY